MNPLTLVAGMHRSGTSALTGVLNLRGLTVAQDLMSPARENERGFFESQSLANIHDTFLHAIDHNWDSARSLPAAASSSEAAHILINSIHAHITNFGGSEGILIKDPRISRLFPYWADTTAKIGFDLRLIIALRNPLEVIASLQYRNKLSFERSTIIWLRYMVEIAKHSRNIKRAVVKYEDLLGDPVAVTNQVAKILDLPIRQIDNETIHSIETFLSKSLRHHEYLYTDVCEHRQLNEWVKRVYAAYVEAAEGNFLNLVDTVEEIFEKLEGSGDVIEALISRNEHQTTLLESRATSAEDNLARTQRNLDIQTKNARQNETYISRLRSELLLKSTALDEIETNLNFILAQKEAEAAANQQECVALNNQLTLATSTSVLQQKRIKLLKKELHGLQIVAQKYLGAIRRDILPLTPEKHGVAESPSGEQQTVLDDLSLLRKHCVNAVAAAGFSSETASNANKSVAEAFDLLNSRRIWLESRFSTRQPPQSDLAIRLTKAGPLGCFLAIFCGVYARVSIRNPLRLAKLSRNVDRIRTCGKFDEVFYLRENWDVRLANEDPVLHYLLNGAAEGRNPSAEFNTNEYLRAHPEANEHRINPMLHSLDAG